MRAVFFDMDGVLTDSEPVICAAAVQMFKERGQVVQEDDFLPFVGAGENRYIGGVAEKYGLELDIAEAKARTYAIYLDLVPSQLKAFPGAVELVEACQAAGLKTAVASSADWIKVEANLKQIGLDMGTLDAIICADKVEHPKPEPDIFLAAASQVGADPGACCVVEDAVNGIVAAKRAGMSCVAVASSFSPDELTQADLVKTAICELTVEEIQRLA